MREIKGNIVRCPKCEATYEEDSDQIPPCRKCGGTLELVKSGVISPNWRFFISHLVEVTMAETKAYSTDFEKVKDLQLYRKIMKKLQEVDVLLTSVKVK